MSEEKKSEAFLDRWSRRKLTQAEAEAPAPAPAVPPPAEAKPAVPLPSVDSLQPDSDFTPFMASDVAPETRRAALKQLFTDAHFNLPDPFEPYSGDLTGEDPIPEAMLKTLNQAKRLIFDKPEPAAPATADPQAIPQTTQAQNNTEPKDVAGQQDA
jgi:hypothetical protein